MYQAKSVQTSDHHCRMCLLNVSFQMYSLYPVLMSSTDAVRLHSPVTGRFSTQPRVRHNKYAWDMLQWSVCAFTQHALVLYRDAFFAALMSLKSDIFLQTDKPVPSRHTESRSVKERRVHTYSSSKSRAIRSSISFYLPRDKSREANRKDGVRLII